MDQAELRNQIRAFVDASHTESERFERELQERAAMVDTYNGVTSEKLLAMEKEGFTVEPNEWWHFNYKDWREYPISNIPFEKLDAHPN